MNLKERIIADIDKKMIKLGELLDVHPEKVPEILRANTWLIRLRADINEQNQN